ncbi:Bug family tripartite tricarboxylate transporter substrate binding protein [[Acidovorax] ebreus]|uniref:Bug family tripartite tricarboxylate transporter substrate binding protein n=1 Tax=Diaphorobacter sp. LI3 TaxID=2952886 RepID=UPI00205E82C3|nr:tripartite tricarboxylate transporter substrate binding protein [Diaphorobacter sp. LI3]
MNFPRWISACLMATALAFSGAASAQNNYPNRPVRVIVPFPAGGTTDIVGRLVAERLQAALGQPFVVDNKSGASGNIGVGETVRSAPDGYTLVLGAPQTLTINPQLFTNMSFNPQKDLAPIAVIASVPNVLLVNNKVPVNNAAELVALAKANVGKLSYGSTSIGSTPHLSAELMKSMTGTNILHIPYRGSAPAMQDLIGGQIDILFDQLASALPHIKAGTVRALAVTTLKRSPSAPDLPTLDESGIKGFDSEGWFGLLAPANTPRPILERINAEVNKALATPEFRERLAKVGAEPVGGSIESFRDRISAESQRWGRVIKFANIKAE